MDSETNQLVTMKTYTLYFTLFGKGMKTTVSANSEEEAKETIRKKIVFDKVERVPNLCEFDLDKEINDFMHSLGIKNFRP